MVANAFLVQLLATMRSFPVAIFRYGFVMVVLGSSLFGCGVKGPLMLPPKEAVVTIGARVSAGEEAGCEARHGKNGT